METSAGRADDGERDGPFADERLLQQLSLEVPGVRSEPVGAYHRQRDVMSHPGVLLSGEQVGGRGAEESNSRIVERRRVRYVDDN